MPLTIIWNDGNDDQYSYVDAGDIEEVDLLTMIRGTQSQSEQWITDTIGEHTEEALDEPATESGIVICSTPGHVAINFP